MRILPKKLLFFEKKVKKIAYFRAKSRLFMQVSQDFHLVFLSQNERDISLSDSPSRGVSETEGIKNM